LYTKITKIGINRRVIMKLEIHPKTYEVTAQCACGASYVLTSTVPEVKVTICSNCHPFYTGTQKFLDTAGRIEKFNRKYEKKEAKK